MFSPCLVCGIGGCLMQLQDMHDIPVHYYFVVSFLLVSFVCFVH